MLFDKFELMGNFEILPDHMLIHLPWLILSLWVENLKPTLILQESLEVNLSLSWLTTRNFLSRAQLPFSPLPYWP
jgi:hypothetical protein